MKIVQITASPLVGVEPGKAVVFGLGDDNKCYFWNAAMCGWQANWDVSITNPAPEKVAANG